MTDQLPRILFADQLGPHFDDGGPAIMPQVLSPFRRRSFHRQKAHLILSAMWHRAEDLGSRVEKRRGETYHEVLSGVDATVINPTSWGLRDLLEDLGKNARIEILPSRGFVASEEQFNIWANGQSKRLLMENFYRHQRQQSGILMVSDEKGKLQPEGGKYNFDHENRLPPPKGRSKLGVPDPWIPVEDNIDEEVRKYLDFLEDKEGIQFRGLDGPRLFPASRIEAIEALNYFVSHRLATFGPFEDAAMESDWAMSHSLLSPAMNVGLLDPVEVINAAIGAYYRGEIELPSAEGFVRQIMGWRDWVWHLYWNQGRNATSSNFFSHDVELPEWWKNLDPSDVRSNCVSQVISEVAARGWTHHINRLMVLGSFALQRGFNPAALNEWFVDVFVDGTPWVMPANVVGMSQYADGGKVATKPYTSGGAYLNSMTNYCQSCSFKPSIRLGDNSCPMTAGYWNFLNSQKENLRGNHRMSRPLAGLSRLADLDKVLEQESLRTEF